MRWFRKNNLSNTGIPRGLLNRAAASWSVHPSSGRTEVIYYQMLELRDAL